MQDDSVARPRADLESLAAYGLARAMAETGRLNPLAIDLSPSALAFSRELQAARDYVASLSWRLSGVAEYSRAAAEAAQVARRRREEARDRELDDLADRVAERILRGPGKLPEGRERLGFPRK